MAQITVIDDSDTTRQFFDKTLSEDHEVDLHESFRDDLTFDDTDVLFLDCWLGEKEGLEVLEEIRAESDVPVVMISGYADKSIVSKAEELGVSGFIQKPLEPEKIRSYVRDVISGEQSEGEGPDVEEVSFYGSPSVLIADDDRTTVELLSRPLEHYNINFYHAGTTDEAWDIVEQHQPDIVVLEATLGGDMSTLELHDQISSDFPSTFFLGITDRPDSEEIDSLRQQDLVDVFYKPFAVDRFVRSLAHLSFVIDRREKGEEVSEKPGDQQEDPGWLGTGLKRTVIISAVFIIIGIMLGFIIKWSQQWTTQMSDNQVSIKRMYEEIEGYLRRDEERDRRYQ